MYACLEVVTGHFFLSLVTLSLRPESTRLFVIIAKSETNEEYGWHLYCLALDLVDASDKLQKTTYTTEEVLPLVCGCA